jgi:hypothetical protein
MQRYDLERRVVEEGTAAMLLYLKERQKSDAHALLKHRNFALDVSGFLTASRIPAQVEEIVYRLKCAVCTPTPLALRVRA